MKKPCQYPQQFLTQKGLIACCLAAVLGVSGCKQEGPAEKAGQKIDRAAENIQQRIQQVNETAQESIQKNGEIAGGYLNKSTDAIKGTVAKTEQELDKATTNAQQKLEQSTDIAVNQLEGAKTSVINKAETTVDYLDDSVITLKVKNAISNDPLLQTSKIEVVTVNGIVKLSGTVNSEDIIGRAMIVANSQPNVKSVQTEMLVNAFTLNK